MEVAHGRSRIPSRQFPILSALSDHNSGIPGHNIRILDNYRILDIRKCDIVCSFYR